MTFARIALGLAVAGAAAGCGGGGGKSSLLGDVQFDVGGRVFYLLDPDRPLAGVTVTLTDVDGHAETAVSAENGLWTATNLHPGPWTERFELAGYEPLVRPLALETGDQNDISNVFVGEADAFLEETRLQASTAPFAVSIPNGESFRDGFEHTIQYSVGQNGAIVITFSRPVYDADADLRDGETSQNIGASFDPVAGTLTFDEADIDTMNGGNTPLTTDADPWTWHRIRIFADAVTPLNGDAESFDATLFFNAVP